MNTELFYKNKSSERVINTGILRKFRIYQKAWLFISLALFAIAGCATHYPPPLPVEKPVALKADEVGAGQKGRARARDIGINIGIYETGRHNAITDVAGVKVGHVTLNSGGSVRTGVTAVIPRDDIWLKKLFAASYIINGNGEATGIAWINEAGWIEAPIMLTNTLSVGRVHDGVVQYMIKRYPDDYVVLPIVAECYDGMLNDIGGLHVAAEHAIAAIETATDGPVAEGCVGAGTGMRCYEFKAGIGTASRVLLEEQGGYTVGVLVNANGGRRAQLRIDGVPVGQEITELKPEWHRGGSFIIVVATNAPLVHRQLLHLAKRAASGLARTGTPSMCSSGEFVLAFSTANTIPRKTDTGAFPIKMLSNDRMDPLYQAVIEATEEAVINAMTAAVTTVGKDGNTIHSIPLTRLQEIMRKYGRLASESKSMEHR
jgi:D-aminopeptidase